MIATLVAYLDFRFGNKKTDAYDRRFRSKSENFDNLKHAIPKGMRCVGIECAHAEPNDRKTSILITRVVKKHIQMQSVMRWYRNYNCSGT